MNFKKVVLLIAFIVLITILTIIGIILSKSSSSTTWPPVVADCPDYWVDLSGNGEMCLNTHKLGKCNIPTTDDKNTMNFNTSPYNGTDGTCSKYTWATNCNVTWDGITYGVNNPCDTTTTDTTTTDTTTT
jgi:hypothetical protein